MPRGRAFYERTKGGTGGRDEQKTPNSEVLNLVKLKVRMGGDRTQVPRSPDYILDTQ
jgi:hypothetical protein